MAYNTFEFLLFFAIFLAVYLIMPATRLRIAVIAAGNLVFYYLAEGKSLLIIVVATSLVVYAASLVIDSIYGKYEIKCEGLDRKDQRSLLKTYKRKALFAATAAVVILLAILIWGKAGRALGLKPADGFSLLSFKRVMIPLGISYYTFSSVGYILDLYWRRAKAERNYIVFLSAMLFFPAITEGPISRYDRLMKNMRELPGFSYERVTSGMQRMIWGYFKKMVVADRFAIFHAQVFGDVSAAAGVEVILAIAASAIHLYADFSGCMDIVIGAAEVMGVTLDENFRQPFFASGAADFWRRWHITLGSWFRDYVYMPLAMTPRRMKKTAAIMKKRGRGAAEFYQTALPLMIVWIMTGLWHGTGWNYLIWGLYWGVLILIETTFAGAFAKVNAALGVREGGLGQKIFRFARVFVYFCIGRMITILGTADGFLVLARRIAAESRIHTLFDGSIFTHGLDLPDLYVALLGAVLIWVVSSWQTRFRVRDEIAKLALPIRWAIYIGGIVLVLILGIYGPGYSASSFVYGGF